MHCAVSYSHALCSKLQSCTVHLFTVRHCSELQSGSAVSYCNSYIKLFHDAGQCMESECVGSASIVSRVSVWGRAVYGRINGWNLPLGECMGEGSAWARAGGLMDGTFHWERELSQIKSKSYNFEATNM